MAAAASRTVVRRFPGRDGCGTLVHTIPVAFATSIAATRPATCSYSSSSISCGSSIAATPLPRIAIRAHTRMPGGLGREPKF